MPTEVTPDARSPDVASVGTVPDRPDRLFERTELVAVASIAVAFVVGVVTAVRLDWVPTSDDALIALHVRDVPTHLPLVGTYSRFGWSHPGPALYYYLSVPYRLFASSPAGLMVGGLAMAFGGTLWAWWVARRSSRLAGALVLAAMTLVMLGREAVELRDPWNPYAGLLLSGTLVVVGWAAADRRAGAVFALLPLGTFLVQAHVGYTPLVTGVVVAAAAGAALGSHPAAPDRHDRGRMASDRHDRGRAASDRHDRGRAASDRHDRAPTPSGVRTWAVQPFPVFAALGGLGLTVLMWLPPLVQQLTGDPGNLSKVALSASAEGAPAGFTTAAKLITAALAVPPSWLGRGLPVVSEGVRAEWVVPVLGAVPLVATLLVLWRGDAFKRRLMVVGVAALAGNAVAISRIAGPVHQYLFSGLGSTTAVVVALSTWVILDELTGAVARRWCALGAFGVALVAGILLSVGQARMESPYPSTEAGVIAIADALIADADGERVFVDAVPEFTAYAALPGFVLELEEAGVDIAVPSDAARAFGEHRTGTPRGRVHYLVAFPGMVPTYLERGWRLVGTYDPLPATTSEEVAALDAEVMELYDRRTQLESRGRDTSSVNELIDENRQRSYDLRADRFPLAVLRAPDGT